MTEIQIETMDETEAYHAEAELSDEELEALTDPDQPFDESTDASDDADVTENVDELETNDQILLEDCVADLLDKIQGDELTMYQVARILNAVLEVFDVQKKGEPYRVRPQMVYNYNRNKMVVRATETDEDGKEHRVGITAKAATKAQAAEFVTRFVSKLI